jgi:hypothetical protein
MIWQSINGKFLSNKNSKILQEKTFSTHQLSIFIYNYFRAKDNLGQKKDKINGKRNKSKQEEI